MKRTARDFALIGKVFAEIGSGRVTRTFIKEKGYIVDGLYNGAGHIYINEDHLLADLLTHELLHRRFPNWSENYVRRTTSYLMRRMSDEEKQALVSEYRKRARSRRKPVELREDNE